MGIMESGIMHGWAVVQGDRFLSLFPDPKTAADKVQEFGADTNAAYGSYVHGPRWFKPLPPPAQLKP